jgi:endonuclease YncB( thermonuclease family)
MATILWPVAINGRITGTRVTDVIDGDTIDALLVEPAAFGLTLTHRPRLRLARINAAKETGVNGTLARGYLQFLLDLHTAQDAWEPMVSITTLKPYKYGGPAGTYKGTIPGGPADYAGEYMAEIELADGTFVSDLMVTAGHAVYWDGSGPRPADQLRGERIA